MVMIALELPKLAGPKLVGAFCAKDAVEMTDRTASVDKDKAVFIVVSLGRVIFVRLPAGADGHRSSINVLFL